MRSRLLLFCLFLMSPALAAAQDSFLSVGAVTGNFNGATVLLWDLGTDRHTYEMGVGYETVGENALQLQWSRRWHFYQGKRGTQNYYWYVGYGARLKFEDDTRFGAIIPVGLDYVFSSGNLELFVEATPTLDFLPDLSPRLGVGFGIRFYL